MAVKQVYYSSLVYYCINVITNSFISIIIINIITSIVATIIALIIIINKHDI